MTSATKPVKTVKRKSTKRKTQLQLNQEAAEKAVKAATKPVEPTFETHLYIGGRKIAIVPLSKPRWVSENSEEMLEWKMRQNRPVVKAFDCNDDCVEFEADFEAFMLSVYELAKSANVKIPPIP